MKVTDAERLMLLMLCDVYDRTGIEGEFDTDFIRSAIYGEKTWSIPWKFSGIPFEDQETPQVVKDVLDFLDMWSLIEFSVSKLSSEDRAVLEKDAYPFGKNPKFSGFDGNSESEYMSTAKFLVHKLERFTEFDGRDFNSHAPKVEAYKRMLSVYLNVRHKLEYGPLDVNDLASILRECVHPENRRPQGGSQAV